MVVPIYILGPSFTKIENKMRSHDENNTKEKKKETKQVFNLSHAPLNQIELVVINIIGHNQYIEDYWFTLLNTFQFPWHVQCLEKNCVDKCKLGKMNLHFGQNMFHDKYIKIKTCMKECVTFKEEC